MQRRFLPPHRRFAPPTARHRPILFYPPIVARNAFCTGVITREEAAAGLLGTHSDNFPGLPKTGAPDNEPKQPPIDRPLTLDCSVLNGWTDCMALLSSSHYHYALLIPFCGRTNERMNERSPFIDQTLRAGGRPKGKLSRKKALPRVKQISRVRRSAEVARM